MATVLKRVRIAVDAHGGDEAPGVVLRSVEQAALAVPENSYLVVGQAGLTLPALPNVRHVIAPEIVMAEEEPVQAIRTKPNASLVLGCRLLKQGEADVFISAGNTGALLVAGLLHVGRFRGVRRPALSLWYPSFTGAAPKLLLDVGANLAAKAEHLLQYALMGSLYASVVREYPGLPRVALLNVGTEPQKGSEALQEAYGLLRAEKRIQFVGNLEARDCMEASCDVLVCEGMSGNVLLKCTEGVARALAGRLRSELRAKGPFVSLGAWLLRGPLRSLGASMNYHAYGGAPLLGLSAPVMKVHGSANEEAWLATFQQAISFVRHNMVERLAEVVTPPAEAL